MSGATLEKRARNDRIYTMSMLGYTHSRLADRFELHPSTIKQIIDRHTHRRRSTGELYGPGWTEAMARAAWAAGLDPLELK